MSKLPESVLVTGGAGFIGSNVAVALARRNPDLRVVALDNLKRRGSELNLRRLHEAGIQFVHGDIRHPGDLASLEPVGALIECSAEASVLAGLDEPDYVVRTNLLGAYHCFELARRHSARVVFLSTSRVYPVGALNGLVYSEGDTRFELTDDQPLAGASAAGIAEGFPLQGARTLYGATKLSAEVLLTEYAESYGVRAVVNRCGVIAGPWQMGRIDQGVFGWWMLAHYFRRPLTYVGFGGSGKQVRDVLHVDDLSALVETQLRDPAVWDGVVVNVGGGVANSLSLQEATDLCRELTGNELTIGSEPATRPGDVRIYVSDCARLAALSGWAPQRSPRAIMEDILEWIRGNENELRAALP